MKGSSHASQVTRASLPRLCEVCGDMMRIRSITFTPKGSEVTYRCGQCATVALEFARPLARGP
jgi:predicted SprT family Zn-dependent metalloprotease